MLPGPVCWQRRCAGVGSRYQTRRRRQRCRQRAGSSCNTRCCAAVLPDRPATTLIGVDDVDSMRGTCSSDSECSMGTVGTLLHSPGRQLARCGASCNRAALRGASCDAIAHPAAHEPTHKHIAPARSQARLRWWWPDGEPRARFPNETAYSDPRQRYCHVLWRSGVLQQAKPVFFYTSLRRWHSDGSLDCEAASRGCSRGWPCCREGRAAPGERSYYLNWIRRDLDPWRDIGGITRVRTAAALPHPALFRAPRPAAPCVLASRYRPPTQLRRMLQAQARLYRPNILTTSNTQPGHHPVPPAKGRAWHRALPAGLCRLWRTAARLRDTCSRASTRRAHLRRPCHPASPRANHINGAAPAGGCQERVRAVPGLLRRRRDALPDPARPPVGGLPHQAHRAGLVPGQAGPRWGPVAAMSMTN